jgi:hypothetical protein
MAQMWHRYNQRAEGMKSLGRLLRDARPGVITRLLLMHQVLFSFGHFDDEYRSGIARSIE